MLTKSAHHADTEAPNRTDGPITFTSGPGGTWAGSTHATDTLICPNPQGFGVDTLPESRRLTLHSGAYVWPTVLFLGLGFALAKGLGYGGGNLRQYLLHALHGLDPAFLANDWFTTQTQPHHVGFNALVVLAGKLISLDLFFAAANAAFAAVFVICIYLLAARLYRAPIIVTAIAVLCCAFGPTAYIGMTSIVGSYFQPSTMGAVGLLAGLTCLIYHRYGLAGLVLGAAAFFHINYMVWIVIILTVVVAVNFRDIGRKHVALLMAPVALAAAFHLPFFIAGKSPEQAAYSALASRILHDIYMPYHSRPLTWGMQPFLRFAAVLAAGGISLIVVGVHRSPGRIALTILGAIVGIVSVGFVLTTAVQVDAVALLFPCRLSPFLVLASLIATAGAIATTARSPAVPPIRTLILWLLLAVLLYCGELSVYGLLCLGAAAAAMFAGRLAREARCSVARMIVLLTGLAFVLYLGGAGKAAISFVAASTVGAVCWRLYAHKHEDTETQHGETAAQRRPPDVHRDLACGLTGEKPEHGGRVADALLFAGPLVPLLMAALLMQAGSARKDLMGPPPAADEQVLYDWCRVHTDPSAVFIVPPLLGGFRQGACRAVVIDWKCMPILPRDTVEWYRRLAEECGTEFDALSQAEAGFREMDADRAQRLGRRYGARYLIVERTDHQGDLSRLPCAYRDQDFSVFDLGVSRSASTAGACAVAGARRPRI
jgi:hypothetical protein